MLNKNRHFNPEEIAVIAEAINNSTYDELPEKWRAHLIDCDECAEEVINVTEMVSDNVDIQIPFNQTDIPQVPKSLKKKNTKILYGFAAAAAVIGFTLILNIFWSEQNNSGDSIRSQKLAKSNNTEINDTSSKTEVSSNQIQKVKSNSTKPEKKQTTEKVIKTNSNKLIAQFKPNPKLEKLYKNMQGTFRGETIEINTKPEILYTKKMQLSWNNTENKTLYVEIFNNKGKEIHRKETTENSYLLPNLKPGLYYWKLIDEDFELLFVGKITVK